MSTALLSPRGTRAANARMLTENWLRTVFASRTHLIRVHTAADGSDADPVPDIEVVRAADDADQLPILVVEVTDGDTGYETGELASHYAAAGVRDYWVLDAGSRKLHVYRDPQPDADAKHGHSYKTVRVFGQNSLISPLAAELHLAQVCNLLPW